MGIEIWPPVLMWWWRACCSSGLRTTCARYLLIFSLLFSSLQVLILFGSLCFTSLSPSSSLVPVDCVWWRWGWMTGWGKMGPERFLLLLLVRCAWWHSSFFSLQILVLFCFTSLVERCFSSFFFSILLIRGLTWIRFFYLPDLARNCVLSFLVPVVVIKAKGTRNFVLSYFVPVVGIKVKGTRGPRDNF